VIVVMKPGASKEQIEHMIARVEELGLEAHPIYGTNRTVIACVGDKRGMDISILETGPAVEKVVPILSPYKMASREVKPEPTVVPVGSFPLGSRRIGVVAGPCAVESRSQLLETAHAVKEAGAIGLRGGAFKPRTSPYSFQGLAEEGLEYLAEAREETGLAVVTEVMSIGQVELVSRYADVIQIGARNMHNFMLLSAAGKAARPVLLKRGWAATMDELLFAAEYVIAAGNEQVILCERGIRTFEEHTRNTLSLATVPALKQVTHLPVMVDPSHGTGHAYLVAPMCRAAVACGADGLLVEVHPDPEHAASDGAQSLTPEAFAEVMAQVARLAEAVGRSL
jgi:3-deoxy-7-phosphoheptulonate synthase